jgi:hypothetical protein
MQKASRHVMKRISKYNCLQTLWEQKYSENESAKTSIGQHASVKESLTFIEFVTGMSNSLHPPQSLISNLSLLLPFHNF